MIEDVFLSIPTIDGSTIFSAIYDYDQNATDEEKNRVEHGHAYGISFKEPFSNFTELTFCFSITEFIFQYDSFMIAVSSSCFIEDSCRDLWLCIGKDRPKLSHEEEGV